MSGSVDQPGGIQFGKNVIGLVAGENIMSTNQPEIGTIWETTTPVRFDNKSLNNNETAEVLVIGAGFTGIRAALALSEAGVSVVVAEKAFVGFGASARNGGQVNPMLPVASPSDLRKTVGDQWFERIGKTSLSSADELFNLIETYKIQCDARRHGWLRANHCESARLKATIGAKEWNKFNAGFEFCGEDDTASLTGTSAYKSATLNPKGGAVHPLKLIIGLANAAHTAGARIYANAGVESLTRKQGKWHARCGKHTIMAEKVIIGTNGYTDGKVWKPLKNSILPLCPIQIATDELPKAQSERILKNGHTISDTRRLIMYARREPNGEFIFGGIGFKKQSGEVGGYGWLDQDIRKIYPELSGHKFRYRWAGQIGITAGRIPHLNEPAPGIICGLGYNGRGVAMANVMGRIIAERVLGKAANQLDYPITQIQRMPFRNTQSVGAPIAMAWWRFCDNREFES